LVSHKGEIVIRGLIFDFDGLILDTESPIYHSWAELYQQFGTELLLEKWSQIIGISMQEHFDPFEKLESQVGRQLDRATLKPQREARETALIASQPILPGVQDYLTAAQRIGLVLGVASSSSRKWVGGYLTRLGLIDAFDVIHTSDDVQRAKPDPALFNLALKSLDLDASEAIVLEDSPNGVTAAKAAGCFCVAVPNPMTHMLSFDHADLRVDSLADLPLDALIRIAEERA
jgi:HAD superfamily hydrolase (TIGR01509 family)